VEISGGRIEVLGEGWRLEIGSKGVGGGGGVIVVLLLQFSEA